jgi:hypothetical protein
MPFLILYIKATVVFVYLSVRAVSKHCPDRQTDTTMVCPDLCFFFLIGFVFCDSYYPTDKGGPARARGGGQAGKDRARGASTGQGGARAGGARAGKDRVEWGARVGKDPVGGSSTGALCTKFTLVYYKSSRNNLNLI